MKIIKEFKEFAIKGNMFDMAIGIIIGAAFNKMVTSIVKDIITPYFGYILGKVNFQDLKIVLQDELKDSSGKVIQEFVAIRYGNFLEISFDFILIAVTMFLVIKTFNRLKKKSEDTGDVTVPTPKDIELLSEIRDLLKEKAA